MEIKEIFSHSKTDYKIQNPTLSFSFNDYFINPLRLKKGNSKLHNILIFDMPAIKTCLNCKDCAAQCYAMKAQRQYPDTRIFRETNLLLFNTDKTTLAKLIVSQLAATKVTTVRLHSSGDFFSQDYINFWYGIMFMFPDIKFYAYTKVKGILNFGYLESLPNFNLIESFINGKVNFGGIDYCLDLKAKYNTFICPATTGKDIKCGKDCSYCISNSNVCFVEH